MIYYITSLLAICVMFIAGIYFRNSIKIKKLNARIKDLSTHLDDNRIKNNEIQIPNFNDLSKTSNIIKLKLNDKEISCDKGFTLDEKQGQKIEIVVANKDQP